MGRRGGWVSVAFVMALAASPWIDAGSARAQFRSSAPQPVDRALFASPLQVPAIRRTITPVEAARFKQYSDATFDQETAGNYQASLSNLAQMRAISDATLGPDFPTLIPTLYVEADDDRNLGDTRRAEAVLQGALTQTTAAYGNASYEYADTLSELGIFYYKTGDLPKAAQMLSAASDLFTTIAARSGLRDLKQVGGLFDPYQRSYSYLADTYYDQGDFEKSNFFKQKEIGLTDVYYGPGNPDSRALQAAVQQTAAKAQQVQNSTTLIESAKFNRNLAAPRRDTPKMKADQFASAQQALTAQLKAAVDIDLAKAATVNEQLVNLITADFGPDVSIAISARLALSLNYSKAGELEKALKLAADDDQATQRIWGEQSLEHAASLQMHGLILTNQNSLLQAHDYLARAVAISSQILPANATGNLDAVDDLAVDDLAIGELSEGTALFRRELALRRARFGANDPGSAATLARLGTVCAQAGDTACARSNFATAMSYVNHGVDENTPAGVELMTLAGRFDLVIGETDKAEKHLEQAYRASEKTLGPTNPQTISTLEALAAVYTQGGAPDKAKPLIDRATAALEAAQRSNSTPDALHLIRALELVSLYSLDNDFDRAGHAIASSGVNLPASAPFRAAMLSVQAMAALNAGQPDASRLAAEKVLDLLPKSSGGVSPETAPLSTLVALDDTALGQFAEAARYAARAGDLSGPFDHRMAAGAFAILGTDEMKLGQPTAIDAARKAVTSELKAKADVLTPPDLQLDRSKVSDAGALGANAWGAKDVYGAALVIASAQIPGQTQDNDLIFAAAQGLLMSPASQAMLQAAARQAGTNEQGALARQYDDALSDLHGLDLGLSKAMGQGDDKATADLQGRIDTRRKAIGDTEQKLDRTFPAYTALARQKALTVAQAQAALQPDEGLVLFAPMDAAGQLASLSARYPKAALEADAAFVVVVTRTTFAWRKIPGGIPGLHTRVSKLLCKLESGICPAGTSTSAAFDQNTAYGLYKDTLQSFEAELKGVDRLYVAASGDMAALPLTTLVVQDPASDGGDPAKASWLADRFAVTTLPTVSALALPLDNGPAGSANLPFVGYGDPLLHGGQTAQARAGGTLDQWYVATADGSGTVLANAAKFDTLPPLPKTGTELNEVAASLGVFGADARQAVHLEARDDELAFKQDPHIHQARVISIATHGILPMSGRDYGEAALVFTPPASPSAQDDGLLTASEAVGLSLRSDWVILSACDTGTPSTSAAPLSDLSKAFLFAGTHALLVSHWQVNDEATTRLVTATLSDYQQGPKGTTKAQALQKAMHDLRTQDARYADPRFWGAFTVIANREN